jgi:hypothetical protein
MHRQARDAAPGAEANGNGVECRGSTNQSGRRVFYPVFTSRDDDGRSGGTQPRFQGRDPLDGTPSLTHARFGDRKPGPKSGAVFAPEERFWFLYLIPVYNSIEVTQATDFQPGSPQQEFLGKEFRLLDRYGLQEDLLGAVKVTNDWSHLIPRLAACHRTFRHWRCENNHDWAEAENSCSLRICPHCSHRRSLILAGRMKKAVVGRSGLRYVVLAEVNTADLKTGIASLFRSWTRLRQSVRWKRKVKGCVLALEVTRNREEGTWHPHLNLLIEGDYFPFEELNQLWLKATKGKGHTSFIRAADAGTVRELIKYVTKLSDLIADPPALSEFLTAIDSLRLLRTYGSFFRLTVDDEENPGVCCPDCEKAGLSPGSIVRLGYVAAHQIALDFEGVLRISKPNSQVDHEIRDAIAFPPVFAPSLRFHHPSALLTKWDEIHKKFRGN